MERILKFGDEDEQAFYDAVNGSAFRAALQDLDNQLREERKYKDQEWIQVQTVRTMIQELMESYGVRLYE